MFLYSFLILLASQSASTEDISMVCHGSDEVLVQDPDRTVTLERTELEETFTCLLYPTHIMNCSWLFHTLEKDTQLSVYISECKDDELVYFKNHTSVENEGSRSWRFDEDEKNHIVVVFNMSRHDKWKVYATKYEMDELRLLPPPSNINASIKDGNLFVAWNLPKTKTTQNPACFDYQLDVGGMETLTDLSAVLHFTKPKTVPTHTYRVRMRTKVRRVCSGCGHWSEWSPTVIVEQSPYTVDPLVILAVSLGIPMMLLAVLLLVRHQRLIKILFPPIPRPPLEYKHFLERNDPLSFFHPAPPARHEEEITEVEDAELNPEKTF
ncbi:granulocyte-macrophage colony-stimulating factor receptor subunit alpha [Austrofundulus limnaeus]|uniref:Granulocyte-macrophage colony-stimulating factor receptor subunit alpha n=1 Tax=Austrofundulus limnaeus TaxID=52670 RepID=A0A2I4B9H3_AUSLI|nr:PREDICTED: granulocyte-macrophage colony-stimulating factor receptor subunit alpha-like [Austrofundulus limnaeus]